MNLKNVFTLLPLFRKYGAVLSFIYKNMDQFKGLVVVALNAIIALLKSAEEVAKLTPTEADDRFIANLIEEVEAFKKMLG